MSASKINIKHNRSAEIHWGVHKLTNKLVWIDDVEGNGYACNCKCACCGSDLKACTQGKIRQHHFKHRGNNGCYYSDEIAEYLKAKELLSSLATMWTPPIHVRIGSRSEIINPESLASVGDVFCTHDANHYPPLLIATINQKTTRIILSFSGYYSANDYKQFINEARERNWDCLEVFLPQSDDGIVVSKELLFEYTPGIDRNKRWIYSSNAHYHFTQLKKASITLPPNHCKYGEIIDTEYPCPLHKREYHGEFYAFKNDCQDCVFRLDFFSDHCRCMAEACITSISDFEIPEDTRRKRFLMLRQENDSKIAEKRSEAERKQQFSQQVSSIVDTNTMPDAQKVTECFMQKICPKCGKQLFKSIGKHKINWLCTTSKCSFYAIVDKYTGEVKFILNE